MRILHVELQHSFVTSSLGSFCALVVMLCALPADATGPIIPWECTGFAGEAQSRCVRTFADLQQEKIATLERDLEVQQRTVQQLQNQVARQASATVDLERKLTRKRSRWYSSPFVQIYPPLGLTLRFGRDTFFGGSLFYGSSHYYGPRLYGHGHRHGHHD